jgi:hypothetical protein
MSRHSCIARPLLGQCGPIEGKGVRHALQLRQWQGYTATAEGGGGGVRDAVAGM